MKVFCKNRQKKWLLYLVQRLEPLNPLVTQILWGTGFPWILTPDKQQRHKERHFFFTFVNFGRQKDITLGYLSQNKIATAVCFYRFGSIRLA